MRSMLSLRRVWSLSIPLTPQRWPCPRSTLVRRMLCDKSLGFILS
jgi:hypothetical protein